MRFEKAYGCWPRYTKKIDNRFLLGLFYMTQNEGLLKRTLAVSVFLHHVGGFL